MKMILRRTVKSGLIGGKKFELTTRLESEKDLAALFKGYPDELVLAYKSVFGDRSVSLKRSEFLRGARFSLTSLNEMIELEERLQTALDQVRRMAEIVETFETDIALQE
ncbi:hypothetical protein [Labrys monachus]|uniref:Uncharacterized protein n=1 Tax=Labrys monachus TaxID=217067 RepID=A0ABU0FKE4_9HYPH|nr:hypothetical protein [Labrys monachus]MDQ0395083.1 hypothetical protein [Labrys monachus]